ncbi:MAG: glycoside hydrolase N-terminal domain-containing protein [Clostridia bacterium]|nr:glycoside hydrolase N-terminal domain-containing protein [Clostridia bacterium]
MKKKIISGLLTLCLLFCSFSFMLPFGAFASDTAPAASVGEIIGESDIPLRLYYDESASHGISSGYDDVTESFGSDSGQIDKHVNDDWERWSIPLGNGYFGANIFGRTDSERIQITEKTLGNPYYVASGVSLGGLNSFSETYIDFNHAEASATGYSRELDLKTAVSTVSYTYGGVTYTREYFTSYPDHAMVIRLDASAEGELGFTLRPTVPYEQEYMNTAGDGGGKTGEVTSSVEGGVGKIVLSGTLEYFDIDFVGLYSVYTNGGTVTATSCTNENGDTDGTITVSGATSAYIVITLGTDYVLSSETFTSSRLDKPTFSTGIEDAMVTVEGYADAIEALIAGKSFEDAYSTLKARHVDDYSSLFGRVTLDLGCDDADFALTTDELLANYKNGSGSTYLEALYFQYGRYLLIASSRSGALPASLQGAWNRYNKSPWSSGFWHNINVQMNYWPAFSTNLAETFEAYVEYNAAYMAKAQSGATNAVNQHNPSVSGSDGGNGWSIDTGAYINDVHGSASIGNLGFTTQLFWEYYAYSGDQTLLREKVYPILVDAARFITKMVREDVDGNYLAIYTDSPEQYVNGVWYYTQGTTYAQSFAYENNYNLFVAAKELGIDFADTTHEDYAILQTVLEQIDKYDPIVVGLSGQVKEFREEQYYGDLGEWNHRHISQLVGLYPANLINGTTPAWMDAAEYTLTQRGDEATGWGVAHRLNLWARVQNGERAYDLLNQLLSVNTATNLWDLHPPFQIDGNLGGTAGISEMLLQSHAGYIEPLAAIPAAWASGSYTGLVARGGFTVSAKWADGVATCFNITSASGDSVSVKYDGIENAAVVDSLGNAVEYTVEDGIITFDTAENATYIISGFENVEKPTEVTGLSNTTEVLGNTVLTWEASADAAAYNVYVAKDSEPTYTLLATTRSTTYTYARPSVENARLTFAVTAVSAAGVESDRALTYRNPDKLDAVINKLSANIVDGELQVAVDANDYSSQYNLYSRANSTAEWTLVSESAYPVIIYAEYDRMMQYGVSVESYFGGESDVIQITSYNTAFDELQYSADNILAGQRFIHTAIGSQHKHGDFTNYGYIGKLTDGDFVYNTGRYSTLAKSTDVFQAYVNLPATFMLGELQIFDFNGSDTAAQYMGAHMTVEVAVDGVWSTVKEYNSNAEILALRKTGTDGKYIAVDLSLTEAQQIRITIDSPINDGTTQNSISINEIQCTGIALNNSDPYSSNILLNKTPVLTDASYTWMVAPGTNGTEQSCVEGITDGTYMNTAGEKHWRTWYGKADMTFDATFDLDGVAMLGELRIYPYGGAWQSAGPTIQIYAFADGVWTLVRDLTYDSTTVSEYLRSEILNKGDTARETWLAFDLSGVKAERLRVCLPAKSTTGECYGMYEMTLDGFIGPAETEYNENMLLGKLPIATETNSNISSNATYGTYGYDRLTDGGYTKTHDNRFSIDAATNNYVTVTYALNGEVNLDTLTVWDFYDGSTEPRSNETTIELYSNGEWVKYMDAEPLYTSSTPVITSGNGKKVTFDLTGYTAGQLRITFKNTNNTNGITIQEIQLSGYEPIGNSVWCDDVFTGLQFVAGSEAGALWDPYTYDKITDDVNNTTENRFVSLNGAKAHGVLDFGGKIATLYTLTVDYDPWTQARCGSNLEILVYNDGEWTTVMNHVHTTAVISETFNLGGVKAEKVAFKIDGVFNVDGVTNGTFAVYEMSCTGFLADMPETAGPVEDPSTNILLGTTNDCLSISGATIHSGTAVKDLSNAFDGSLDTRYAVWDASPYSYTLDIDLNGEYSLYTLSIAPFANENEASRSDKTHVEVYIDGVWVRVTEDFAIAPTNKVATSVNLGGVVASKLRISFANTTWSASATIFEISCTTGTTTSVDRTALLEAYKALDELDAGDEMGMEQIKEMKLEELKAHLMNTEATQAEIDSYVTEVNAEKESVASGEAPVTNTYGDFTSYNLSLQGDISFNFYGDLADDIATTFPNGFVYVEYSDGTAEKHSLSDLGIADNGMHMISLTLAAAEMTDTVKLRLILDGSNCGEVIEESVKSYSESLLANADYADSHALVTAMLNYGAYAQLYFGYNTDNLANSGVDSTLDSVTESASIGISGSATGLSLASWTLALEHEVEAKIYFTLQSNVNINGYTVTVTTPGGESYEASVESFGSRYRVVVKNIGAGYLDNSYVIRFTNNVDGTYVDLTISAMCYVSQVLANDSAPETLKNLVVALRIYSDVADTYLGES